jgi:hypothetical protein
VRIRGAELRFSSAPLTHQLTVRWNKAIIIALSWEREYFDILLIPFLYAL